MPQHVVFIGGGPASYPAAILAARAGFKVTIVERDLLGGTCLQLGCIPSKILLEAGRWREHLETFQESLTAPLPAFSYEALIALSRKRVAAVTRNLTAYVKREGVTIIRGTARFADPKTLSVDTDNATQELVADAFVIACGAKARTSLQGVSIPYPHPQVWTNREALTATEKPESVIILGGGAIGCEFASFYNGVGIPVTIVEILPRILAGEDADISKELTQAFTKRGITVHTERKLRAVETNADGVRVTLDDGTELTASHLLLAVGIVPATEHLGLDAAGVAVNAQGWIPVALPAYRTNVEHIYAIGDAIAVPDIRHPALAHAGTAEGERVVTALKGETPALLDYDNVPACTFTIPEVAHVGLTREEAERRPCPWQCPKHEIREQTVRYTHLGRSTALGLTEGFVRVVAHFDTWKDKPVGHIIGAHAIGEDASEIIAMMGIAISSEETIDHLAQHLIIAHPTWTELWLEALKAFDDNAPHVPTSRRKT